MTNVENSERRPWRVHDIIRAVAKASGIPMRDITGPMRDKELVSARHAVMWIARQQGCWSYSQIGGLLGKRDHTTVLHGVRKAEARLKTDKWFRMIVEGAEQALASGNIPTIEAAAKQVVAVSAPRIEQVPPVQPEPQREPKRRRSRSKSHGSIIEAGDLVEFVPGAKLGQFTDEWWVANAQRAYAGLARGYAAEFAASSEAA